MGLDLVQEPSIQVRDFTILKLSLIYKMVIYSIHSF